MSNKFSQNILIVFGVIIFIIFSYILIINAYINEQSNPVKETLTCETNWLNYTIQNNQTTYLENNIYRCEDDFQVCDSVSGKECLVSKEFYLSMEDSGNNVKIGFGDSITASVKRNRWYGTIYESGGQSNLYIFDLINIPMKINNIDLVWYHQLVSMICLAILILFFSIQSFNIAKRRNK